MQELSRRYEKATKKDHERAKGLLTYCVAHGLTAAVSKAITDASSIRTPAKCEARARILEGEGQRALAKPFRDRMAWLNAKGGQNG